MEVVNKLPRPTDPSALQRLVDAQRILCSRCVSEEDCHHARGLLEELASPADTGGFDYFPALLTLASLHATGFEPAISQDEALAARQYIQLLTHEKAATGLGVELLDDAAAQLCALIKDGGAKLEEREIGLLGDLGQGKWCGALGNVASWVRFARAEAERMLQESREDPAVREQRILREKSREEARAQELAGQRDLAKKALAHADELRQQGNDDYRQGHLPGNAKANLDLARSVERYSQAIVVLSATLGDLTMALEESNEVRRQRGILHSNAAQVELMLANWSEAAHHAEKAIVDDPQAFKTKYRLAKARVGLDDWEAAAKIVDDCLARLEKERKQDTEDSQELWKLADDISGALPSFRWSCEKPAPKPSEDYELRLPAKWGYGPEDNKQVFEIRLTSMGALVFDGGEVKIELMRKSKLRWRGEYEMNSGIVVLVAYEPGSDVLVVEFNHSEDAPAEVKAKGVTRFTAQRLTAPAPPPPAVNSDLDPPPEPRDVSAPCKDVEAAVAAEPALPAEEALPDGMPDEVHFSGPTELSGTYLLVPDEKPPTPGGHTAVFRQTAGGAHFLWNRGGSWCVTATMNSSSLAAPSLARCPDVTGKAKHPLQVRRQRWYIHRGRGQEELDPAVVLQSCSPAAAGHSAAVVATARGATHACDANDSLDAIPAGIRVTGRHGDHTEVNGDYKISPLKLLGRPVYVHVAPDIDKQALSIFFDSGCWVIAEEVTALPRALARCRPKSPESAHPLQTGGVVWEFLCDKSLEGRKGFPTVTRTYMVDRSVAVSRDGSDSAPGAAHSPAGIEASSLVNGTHFEPSGRSERASASEDAVRHRSGGTADAGWVVSASAEVMAGEVCAAIVVSEAVEVNMQKLDIDVAQDVLKVSLAGHGVFELRLPSTVDASANPKAKWAEKSRTLRVRLALLPSTDGMD